MVNTERRSLITDIKGDYNILNIVVNTELFLMFNKFSINYNILNIVVNTEQKINRFFLKLIITY